MTRISTLLAASALCVFGAASANAIPIAFQTTLTLGDMAGGANAASYTGTGGTNAGLLVDALSFNPGGVEILVSTSAFGGNAGATGDVVTFTPNPINAGNTLVDMNWGTYSFTATTVAFTTNAVTNAVNYLFAGNFHDSSGFFADQTADLSLGFTQTGSGVAPSFSGTFDSPQTIQVPEPMSVAMMGAGLAGLALARRRRA